MGNLPPKFESAGDDAQNVITYGHHDEVCKTVEPKVSRGLSYFEMYQAGMIWLGEADEDADDE
ncbi:hypothetical protein GC387_23025 [Pseudomonas sp. MWU12-2323]|nr:hypothetical protein [Pseudomonas sp. MWU12-2323]